MNTTRTLVLIGILLTAAGFTSNSLGEHLGPIDYKGYLVFDYPEGDNPINNIIFTLDSTIADKLIIVNVPYPWSYSYASPVLTLSDGSVSQGESVRVTVSLNTYFEEGEYPISSVGTTTAGETSQASGHLLVGDMYVLKFLGMLHQNRFPLAGIVACLGFFDLFLISRVIQPRKDYTQQLKEIDKIEKEIAKNEVELENTRKEMETLKDEIEGDENLHESIEDSQDGSEWGSATWATKLKREIAKKKLRLAELDNLQRYYEVEIRKLKDKIAGINKAIEQSIGENLPPT